ncbi:hypothetical protein MrNuV_ORF010 [Macrobrachium rosenbergii nudivirus]|nr:hypothetical protein MrNuV_ORF010 [Macrobrachium rosenbergii nudivirus]
MGPKYFNLFLQSTKASICSLSVFKIIFGKLAIVLAFFRFIILSLTTSTRNLVRYFSYTSGFIFKIAKYETKTTMIIIDNTRK